MEHLSVIFPAGFQNVVSIEDLAARPYNMIHLATNTVTGEMHWAVEAEDQKGITQFRQDYKDKGGDIRPDHKHKGNKADWFQNSFPDFADGISDPLQVVLKGRVHLDNITKAMNEKRVGQKTIELPPSTIKIINDNK